MDMPLRVETAGGAPVDAQLVPTSRVMRKALQQKQGGMDRGGKRWGWRMDQSADTLPLLFVTSCGFSICVRSGESGDVLHI